MENLQMEALADIQHDIWASWMEYQFSCGTFSPNGDWVMPAEKVKHWQRQISTKYEDLTNAEKESDREQVRKFEHLI